MGAAHQALVLHCLHHVQRKTEGLHTTVINVSRLKLLTDIFLSNFLAFLGGCTGYLVNTKLRLLG